MPDAAQSDAATKPADPNAANAQQAADLAARQQQLQQQHAAIDNNLENLLERRPELVDAARQHQLDRLSRLAQQAADLAERQRQLGEQLAEAPQTDPAANPSTAPQAGDRPAGEQPAAERSPGEPAAANPQPANASRPEPSRPQPPTPEPQAANPSTDGPAKGTQPAGQSPAGNDPSAGSQPGESAAGETPAGNKPASDVAPRQTRISGLLHRKPSARHCSPRKSVPRTMPPGKRLPNSPVPPHVPRENWLPVNSPKRPKAVNRQPSLLNRQPMQ